MAIELLPCPHCGSPAEFGIVDDPNSRDDGGQFVACIQPLCCACLGLIFACGDDPRPILAERWNRRPPARPDSG